MNRIAKTLFGAAVGILVAATAFAGEGPTEQPWPRLETVAESRPDSPAEIEAVGPSSPLSGSALQTIPASQLMPAVVESDDYRSVQLEQIAQQADRQTRHGFELAGRGAYFAARSEFIGSLRLIAEGLDAEQSGNLHGRALAAALTAMREAEDFLPTGSQLEADLDIGGIIAAHATPALKDKRDGLTAMGAHCAYLTYAQEQFAVAEGREVAGSMALHALGKLHTTLAGKKAALVAGAESKSMAYFQAAMLVYPQNHLAANDLGVMLAQSGRWSDAKTMLEYSLSLKRQSATWRNLAVVHQNMGRKNLADYSARQAVLTAQAEAAGRRAPQKTASSGAVQWVDQQSFSKSATGIRDWPASERAPALAKPVAPSAGRAVRGTQAYKR